MIHNGNYIMAWISAIFFVFASQIFWAVAFGSLLVVTPIELTSVANSVCCVLCLLASMIQAYIFGILVIDNDETGNKNYKQSLWMLNILILIGLICAITVHWIDVIDDGPLHKRAEDKLKIHDNDAEEYSIGTQENTPLLDSIDYGQQI